MFAELPRHYDETYKGFTLRGSRVLALGYRFVDNVPSNDTNAIKQMQRTRSRMDSSLPASGVPLHAQAGCGRVAQAAQRLFAPLAS